MGVWAEIKHALNSTLGTSSFKPLNTLITDYITTKASELTTHITTQATGVKTAIGTTETNVKSHITTETTGVETHVTSQATTIKNLITSETTGVETHVTSKTNEIINQYYNGKSLTASDEVFYIFSDALSSYMTEKGHVNINVDLCEFVMPLSGSVNLLYEIGLSVNAYPGNNAKAGITITKNGSNYVSDTSGYIIGGSSNPARILRLDGQRGDVFKIQGNYNNASTGNDYRAYMYLHSLNATVNEGGTINLQTLI